MTLLHYHQETWRKAYVTPPGGLERAPLAARLLYRELATYPRGYDGLVLELSDGQDLHEEVAVLLRARGRDHGWLREAMDALIAWRPSVVLFDGVRLVIAEWEEAQLKLSPAAARKQRQRERERRERDSHADGHATVQGSSRGLPRGIRSDPTREETIQHDPSADALGGAGAPSSSAGASRPGATRAARPQRKQTALDAFDFEAVYREHYPRKEGKEKGLEQCRRQIRTQADFEAFTAAVKAYAAKVAREGTEPKYVKHFSSFMAPGVWNEHVPAAQASAPAAPAPRRDSEIEVFDAVEYVRRQIRLGDGEVKLVDARMLPPGWTKTPDGNSILDASGVVFATGFVEELRPW